MRPALAIGCLAIVGCATAVPYEKGYIDPRNDTFDLVKRAIENSGGDVVAEVRQMGAVTGHFSADLPGGGLYLDVTIERRGGDESWVRASARGEFSDVAKEELEPWRGRFFAELDALAADLLHQVDRRGLGRPPDAPVPTPVERLPR